MRSNIETSGALELIWRKRFRRGPMDLLTSVELRAGKGLNGNVEIGGQRQVTLICRERWNVITESLGYPIDPSIRRANLLVSGLDLENSRGHILRVGSCRLRINGETRPCERMDEAAPGLRAALDLNWGGGAYAEVIDNGTISVGDVVAWEENT